jgi:hypothetical protein
LLEYAVDESGAIKLVFGTQFYRMAEIFSAVFNKNERSTLKNSLERHLVLHKQKMGQQDRLRKTEK